MSTERETYFLALAQEWWDTAAALRARGVPEGDPALGVWREAAWCHLLFTRGHHAAVVTRLRAVVLDVTGVPAAPAMAHTGLYADKYSRTETLKRSQNEGLGPASCGWMLRQSVLKSTWPAA